MNICNVFAHMTTTCINVYICNISVVHMTKYTVSIKFGHIGIKIGKIKLLFY